MSLIDLHFHSNHSDGKMNINELADAIINANIKVGALTDHDTIEGIIPLENLLLQQEIKLIRAVELTALFNEKEIHILVFDFDINKMQKFINKKTELTLIRKNEEFSSACKLANMNGFKLSKDLQLENGKPVGLTIAKDVLKNNVSLLRQRHNKILTTDDFFHLYQDTGKCCYTRRAGVEFEWVIENIRTISKNIILAHPFVAPSVAMKPLDIAEINKLIKHGFTGIEVYHNNTSPKQINQLLKIVKDNYLSYTGGSDFHGRVCDTPLGHYDNNKIIPGYKLNI